MLKEKKDKEENIEQETLEENVVNKQEILTTPDSETEVNVPVTVYTGHETPVTSGTSSQAAPTKSTEYGSRKFGY